MKQEHNHHNNSTNPAQNISIDLSDVYQQKNGAKIALQEFDRQIDFNQQKQHSQTDTDNKENDAHSTDNNATGANSNTTASDDNTDVLDRLLSKIEPVNFIQKLKEYVSDEDLSMYVGKNKQVQYQIAVVIIVNELLAIAEQHNMDICKDYNGTLPLAYIFNGKYWEHLKNERLQNFLIQGAIKMGYMELMCQTPRFNENILKTFWCSRNMQKMSYDNRDIILINLNNCTLEITTKNINPVPHNKNHFLKYKLNYDYDKNAIAPEFTKYLNKVLSDPQSQAVALEALGSPFLPRRIKIDKCVVFYGSGSNGKTVLHGIAKELYGEQNFVSFSLQDLMNQNNRAVLNSNILVNFGNEMDGKNLNYDLVKSLICGEPVQACHKYQDPFVMQDYARFIFNSNNYPEAKEVGHAYFRRWLFVAFDTTIPESEQDPHLAERIKNTEMSGVLNLVIAGAMRLMASKNHKFSFCKKSKQLHDEFKQVSDIVAIFIHEHRYRPDAENKILLQEIYAEFKQFCVDRGYLPVMKDIEFSSRLRSLGYIARPSNQGKTYVWAIKNSNMTAY